MIFALYFDKILVHFYIIMVIFLEIFSIYFGPPIRSEKKWTIDYTYRYILENTVKFFPRKNLEIIDFCCCSQM